MHGENIKSRNQIVYALCNEPGGGGVWYRRNNTSPMTINTVYWAPWAMENISSDVALKPT